MQFFKKVKVPTFSINRFQAFNFNNKKSPLGDKEAGDERQYFTKQEGSVNT